MLFLSKGSITLFSNTVGETEKLHSCLFSQPSLKDLIKKKYFSRESDLKLTSYKRKKPKSERKKKMNRSRYNPKQSESQEFC